MLKQDGNEVRNVEVCLDFHNSDVSPLCPPKRLVFVRELVFRLNSNRAGVSHKPSPAGTAHLCSDIARTPLTSSLREQMRKRQCERE